MQWKRAMKKDCTFRKAMETQKELQDSEGFDLLESTELAINCGNSISISWNFVVFPLTKRLWNYA